MSNTEACREREDLIAFRYDDGYSRGTDQGPDRPRPHGAGLPARASRWPASKRKPRSCSTRATPSRRSSVTSRPWGCSTPTARRSPIALRDNPCDSVTPRHRCCPQVSAPSPCAVDGDVVATAWFCQSITPSVTVIGSTAPARRDRAAARLVRAAVPEQRQDRQLPDAGLVPAQHDRRARHRAARPCPATASRAGRSTAWPRARVRCRCRSPPGRRAAQRGPHRAGAVPHAEGHGAVRLTPPPAPGLPGRARVGEPLQAGHQGHRRRR